MAKKRARDPIIDECNACKALRAGMKPTEGVQARLIKYTLGPPLRIADIKNMGKDFAPEDLRICPWPSHGP